jgi:hypothetical protein
VTSSLRAVDVCQDEKNKKLESIEDVIMQALKRNVAARAQARASSGASWESDLQNTMAGMESFQTDAANSVKWKEVNIVSVPKMGVKLLPSDELTHSLCRALALADMGFLSDFTMSLYQIVVSMSLKIGGIMNIPFTEVVTGSTEAPDVPAKWTQYWENASGGKYSRNDILRIRRLGGASTEQSMIPVADPADPPTMDHLDNLGSILKFQRAMDLRTDQGTAASAIALFLWRLAVKEGEEYLDGKRYETFMNSYGGITGESSLPMIIISPEVTKLIQGALASGHDYTRCIIRYGVAAFKTPDVKALLMLAAFRTFSFTSMTAYSLFDQVLKKYGYSASELTKLVAFRECAVSLKKVLEINRRAVGAPGVPVEAYLPYCRIISSEYESDLSISTAQHLVVILGAIVEAKAMAEYQNANKNATAHDLKAHEVLSNLRGISLAVETVEDYRGYARSILMTPD